MKPSLRLLMAALVAAHAVTIAQAHDPDPRDAGRPLIQIALLLDTSNSMDGLIGQAKSQLWRIVNDLASSRRRGRAPRIEVALYEYGNNNLPAGENYVRQILPFSNDLDRLSERLFALSTNGGDEYCGAVIQDAAKNLSWDRRDHVYKVVFIAGNEPFTQGGIDFKDAVQTAVGRGIVVNTIFCGNRTEGIETRWKEGADRGRGDYFSITQDGPVAVQRTPYDEEIEKLGAKLNDTYVAYGSAGLEMSRKQERADKAAMTAAPAGAAVERSLYKGKRQYSESLSENDAVGQLAAGKAVSEMKEDLPAEYRSLGDKELESALKEKAAEREKVQKELDRLGRDRAAFLSKKAPTATNNLDEAVLKAVRTQAATKEFVFEK
jgi:hypothetical protein